MNRTLPEFKISALSDEVFKVIVFGSIVTTHLISIPEYEYERLTSKKQTKESLVSFSFRFLLEREENTMILPDFSIVIVGKYFPEFEQRVIHWALTK